MEKVSIKMTDSARGVDDGKIQTENFVKGETYQVGESLANAFINDMKVAKKAGKKDKKAEVKEDKMVKSDENKGN